MNDVGLLASMYMNGIQLKILAGETDINIGSVYENFVAQERHAGGFSLHYFSSRKVGEVDFVIRLRQGPALRYAADGGSVVGRKLRA